MRRLAVLCLVMLTGCQPTMHVEKVDAAAASQLGSTVKVVEGAPPAGATLVGAVEATSCKFQMWDPAPSRTNAVLQMQSIAHKMNANTIANVYCEPPNGFNPGRNCYSSIRCTATAYSMPN